MGITRRGFVKGTIGLGALGIGGGLLYKLIEVGGANSKWEKKLKTLEENAGPQGDGVKYNSSNGFEYHIKVDGKDVHAYLSKTIESQLSTFKYVIGDTTVYVNVHFGPDSVTVENNGKTITNPDVIKRAETLTDKVLDTLVSEQEKLIKERNLYISETVRKDLGVFK